MEATSEEATTTTQEEGASTTGSRMEDTTVHGRALRDLAPEGFTPTCFAYGKLGYKSFQCPDKKTAAMPAKAPTIGGEPPQLTPQQSASRGRLTYLKEG
jgi:hypothetical protein